MRSSVRRQQRGSALIIVMVLFGVALLGGVVLARFVDTGVLASGNLAAKEGALHASEVGTNAAFKRLQALADDNVPQAGWYASRTRDVDAAGMPLNVDWDAAPELTAGDFRVRYVVDRQCVADAVTEPLRQCLVTEATTLQSEKVGAEALEPPAGKQFRITVRVDGPSAALTYAQTLVTRGGG